MASSEKFPQAKLHHIQLTAESPKELAAFYGRALMMDVRETDGGYLCEGPARRVLFAEGPKRNTGYCAFSFRSSENLLTYRAELEERGVALEVSPSALFEDTAFGVRDPDGNVMVFGWDEEDGPDDRGHPDARLQHVTFRTKNLPPMIDHYENKLSFFLADLVATDEKDDLRTAFFASDPEHHSLAVFTSSEARLDHHSYELSGWDQIRDWADHFSDLGLSLRWGPGRHGPGNNLFIFLKTRKATGLNFQQNWKL